MEQKTHSENIPETAPMSLEAKIKKLEAVIETLQHQQRQHQETLRSYKKHELECLKNHQLAFQEIRSLVLLQSNQKRETRALRSSIKVIKSALLASFRSLKGFTQTVSPKFSLLLDDESSDSSWDLEAQNKSTEQERRMTPENKKNMNLLCTYKWKRKAVTCSHSRHSTNLFSSY